MKKGLKILSALFLLLGMGMISSCTKTEDIEHIHTYSTSWSYDETDHWHPATCQHDYEKKDKTAHYFTSDVTTEPTHTTMGLKTYTCKCGYSYTEDIPMLTQHTGDTEWHYDDTNHWHECECGEHVDTDNHSYGESVTKKATCTDKGEKTFTCECGKSYTEDIDALGHTFVKVNAKQATLIEGVYTPENIEYYQCSNCQLKAKDALGENVYDKDDDSYLVKATVVEVGGETCYLGSPVDGVYTDIFSGKLYVKDTQTIKLTMKNAVINDGIITIGDYTFGFAGDVLVNNAGQDSAYLFLKNTNTNQKQSYIYSNTAIKGLKTVSVHSNTGAAAAMALDLVFCKEVLSTCSTTTQSLVGADTTTSYTNTNGYGFFQIASTNTGKNAQIKDITLVIESFQEKANDEDAAIGALDEVEALFDDEYVNSAIIELIYKNAQDVQISYELNGTAYTKEKLEVAVATESDTLYTLKVTAVKGTATKEKTITFTAKKPAVKTTTEIAALFDGITTSKDFADLYIVTGTIVTKGTYTYISDGTTDVQLYWGYNVKPDKTTVLGDAHDNDTICVYATASLYVTGGNAIVELKNPVRIGEIVKAEYEIEVSNVDNGTATADKAKYVYGEQIVLTITPDTNYEIKSVEVTNATKVDNTHFTCNGAGKMVVTVEFKSSTTQATKYDVTVVDTESKVTADITKAEEGETITLTVGEVTGKTAFITVTGATKVTDTTYTCDGTGAVEISVEWLTVKSVVFSKTNMNKVGSYTTSFDTKGTDPILTLSAFNNNNLGWDSPKCGIKGGDSVAKIRGNITGTVKKVTVDIKSILNGYAIFFTGLTLNVYNDSNYSSLAETVTATPSTGTITFDLAQVRTNCYYSIDFETAKPTVGSAKNGFVEVASVSFIG